MSFEEAFSTVVGEEGDYSDDPNDSGGKTRYGITEAVARKHGYTGEMRDLPFATARDIYRADYWDALSLDTIDQISERVAFEIFDTGVNTGVYWSVWWFQRILNAFNKDGTIYPDITADGHVGKYTLDAFKRYVTFRKDEGIDVLLKALNCLQGAYYIATAEHDPKDEAYAYGWIRNRITL